MLKTLHKALDSEAKKKKYAERDMHMSVHNILDNEIEYLWNRIRDNYRAIKNLEKKLQYDMVMNVIYYDISTNKVLTVNNVTEIISDDLHPDITFTQNGIVKKVQGKILKVELYRR